MGEEGEAVVEETAVVEMVNGFMALIPDAEMIVDVGVKEAVGMTVAVGVIVVVGMIAAAETDADAAMLVDENEDEQDLKAQTSIFGPLSATGELHQQPMPMQCRSENHDPDTRVKSPRRLIDH